MRCDSSIDETERRRARQVEYNDEHSITPQTVRKAVLDMDPSTGARGDYVVIPVLQESPRPATDAADIPARIEELRSEMLLAAEQLDFEKAAQLRDRKSPGPQRGHAAPPKPKQFPIR